VSGHIAIAFFQFSGLESSRGSSHRFFLSLFPGWDPKPEDDYSELRKAKVSELDKALSTLIIDLKKQKILDRTLVVLSSDYGRYPFFETESLLLTPFEVLRYCAEVA
jgi:membrane-anchored protein YejM (alkaline phosphatase superfamily)